MNKPTYDQLSIFPAGQEVDGSEIERKKTMLGSAAVGAYPGEPTDKPDVVVELEPGPKKSFSINDLPVPDHKFGQDARIASRATPKKYDQE